MHGSQTYLQFFLKSIKYNTDPQGKIFPMARGFLSFIKLANEYVYKLVVLISTPAKYPNFLCFLLAVKLGEPKAFDL